MDSKDNLEISRIPHDNEIQNIVEQPTTLQSCQTEFISPLRSDPEWDICFEGTIARIYTRQRLEDGIETLLEPEQYKEVVSDF